MYTARLLRLPFWLAFWLLSLGFGSAVWAQVSVRLTERDGPMLQLSGPADRWLRLEWSADLGTWQIALDSIVPPMTIPAVRPEQGAAFYRTAALTEPEPPYVFAVIGDSTAAGDFPEQDPPRVHGWGDGLIPFADFEDSETTVLMTTAEPAISSKSFFISPRNHVDVLNRIKPEAVLIQLGQIDEFTPFLELKKTTLPEYRVNLGRIVDIIRGYGGVPLLVTPLPFRENEYWRSGQQISADDVSRLSARAEVVRSLALEKGVWLIDLYRIVGDHYRSVTLEELAALGAFDAHHLSLHGSEVVADLAIGALPDHFQRLFFGRD